MPKTRYREFMKHALLTSVTAWGLVLLSMHNASADIFNATTVADGPLLHLGFVDYKAPIGGRGIVGQSANWKWDVTVTFLDPDTIYDDVAVLGWHLIAPHPELNEVAPTEGGFHWELNLSPGDERDLTITPNRHLDGPHVDWLQVRVDKIDDGVSRIWFRLDHTSSGETPPPLLPRKPPTSIGMEYFRGSCTVGAVGRPCNDNTQCGGVCAVTATTADDTTRIGLLPGAIHDLYRGEIGAGIGRGTFAYPHWIVNVTSCWDPPFADWIADDTGFMDQTLDPNPPSGRATYYDYTVDTDFGPASNVNDLGCSNPGMCSNPGWCELGTTPGVPCTVAPDCGPGGTCTIKLISCHKDAGASSAGGCSSHPICTGGANTGLLCVTGTDCSGFPCTAPSAPAGLCASVSLSAGPMSADGCLLVGDPRRITRVVPAAVIAACP